jgi:Asp-tRNA(Asn)/Glu-tRNA(Gln) amidotransferase A subunit family amidase
MCQVSPDQTVRPASERRAAPPCRAAASRCLGTSRRPRLASGRTTAHSVTQAHLDRIAAYDKRGPLINSLMTINPRALDDAVLVWAGAAGPPGLAEKLPCCRFSA